VERIELAGLRRKVVLARDRTLGAGRSDGVSARNWVSPYNYIQNNPISRIDPTGYTEDGYGFSALRPGPADPTAFKNFEQNVIIGPLGDPQTRNGETLPRSNGAAFFGRNITIGSKPNAVLTTSTIKRVLKSK